MKTSTYVALSLCAALGASCTDASFEPELDDVGCVGESKVTVEALPARLGLDDESVTIHGTASPSLGLAIRRITVGGVDATQTSFNFGAWSAVVAGDIVRALVPANATADATVKVPVAAFDACSALAAGTTEAEVLVDVEEP